MALNSWDFDDFLFFWTYERGQAGRETVASCKDCRGNLTSNFLRGILRLTFALKRLVHLIKDAFKRLLHFILDTLKKVGASDTRCFLKGRCI